MNAIGHNLPLCKSDFEISVEAPRQIDKEKSSVAPIRKRDGVQVTHIRNFSPGVFLLLTRMHLIPAAKSSLKILNANHNVNDVTHLETWDKFELFCITAIRLLKSERVTTLRPRYKDSLFTTSRYSP